MTHLTIPTISYGNDVKLKFNMIIIFSSLLTRKFAFRTCRMLSTTFCYYTSLPVDTTFFVLCGVNIRVLFELKDTIIFIIVIKMTHSFKSHTFNYTDSRVSCSDLWLSSKRIRNISLNEITYM